MSAGALEERLARLRASLVSLGAADTVEDVLAIAPHAVRSIGFDRAIVSRLEDDLWIPEVVLVAPDPAWARRILEAGRSAPQWLEPTLVETSVARDPRTVAVEGVQHNPSVNRAIADASRSESYLVAPILSGSAVIGFLHADRYFSRRPFDSVDREMLAALAEGLSLAIARAELAERLRRIGQLADGRSSWPVAVSHADPVTAPGRALLATVLESARTAPRLEGAHMTSREAEVATMMASGMDNRAIAAQLTLSEETVKTHVKHVFRKLGATTRAEAMAIWLGTSGDNVQRGRGEVTPVG